MNRKVGLLICLPLLLFGLKVFCQTKDAGLWMSATIEKRLSNALTLQISPEIKLMENFSEASTVFADLGLEYRITKPLKVSLHYRHLFDRQLDDYYERNSRFYADITYRIKFSKFSLLLRERMQSTGTYFNNNDNINMEWYSRTKATLKVTLHGNWKAMMFAEVFTPLAHPEYNSLDKLRYGAGCEWNIRKKYTIDLSYMVQSKFYSGPQIDNVIFVGYTYTL